MSEPVSQEKWKEPVKIEGQEKPDTVMSDLLRKQQSLHLEIQAKLEKWYQSTFINQGLDMQTFNHIYKSVEGLKKSIAETFKEK